MDFEKRKEEFLSGYGKLVAEFQCDFLTVPKYIPAHTGDASWVLVMHTDLVDISNSPTPSPFSA